MEQVNAMVVSFTTEIDFKEEVGAFSIRKIDGQLEVVTFRKEDEESKDDFFKRVVKDCFYLGTDDSVNVRKCIHTDNKAVFGMENAHTYIHANMVDVDEITDGEGVNVWWDDINEVFAVINGKGICTLFKVTDACEFREVGTINKFRSFNAMLLRGHYADDVTLAIQKPF